MGLLGSMASPESLDAAVRALAQGIARETPYGTAYRGSELEGVWDILPRNPGPYTRHALKLLMVKAMLRERERCADILTFAAHLPDTTPEQKQFLDEICAAILRNELDLRWAVGK